MLVDRAMRSGAVLFEDEDGLVWPFAAGQEIVVRRRSHKNIGKRRLPVSAHVGVVTHSEAGREVYPAAIALRTHQFSVAGVLRAGIRIFRRLAAAGAQEQASSQQSTREHRDESFHGNSPFTGAVIVQAKSAPRSICRETP